MNRPGTATRRWLVRGPSLARLGWLALLVLGACLAWYAATPAAPVDWHAGLRRASPEHFAPSDDADGWPIPRTTVGVAVLDCVKRSSHGPHTIPTLAQREAVLACAKAQ
jgi:hypothetical protein